MAKLVRLFISARQQRLVSLVLGLLLFGLFVAAAALFARHEVVRLLVGESLPVLRPFADRADIAAGTFAALKSDVTAPPCTPEFDRQLRRVAYQPNRFNEFVYAPNGIVECTSSMGRFDPPIALGQPDMPAQGREPAMWVDRGLTFAGLNGLVGTVLHLHPFAIVLPLETVRIDPPGWMAMEVVFVAPSGRWWHRGGTPGVYQRYVASLRQQDGGPNTALRNSVCLLSGRVCVVTEAPLAALLSHGKIYLIATLIAALALAAWLARMARVMIVRRFAFESRFRRHLEAGSIVCVYQPIMHLHSGEIAGCEVLARWRDVDDSIVYPDRFIPLVEQAGLTRSFTRMVAERAHAELIEALPEGRKLMLTFNIFPRDLDAAFLCDVFGIFASASSRFEIGVEIVESNVIEVADAPLQIEALRAAGIRTYIDDFGTGYSNIQNLVALTVDGVKLDRSFAMAATGSVMARMLGHAIDMVRASERTIVVEGVETAERLRQLRAVIPPIDLVQGYFISRPLSAEDFAAFLVRHAEGFHELELVA
jgi:sensor c-di-GMP phosphodiesterase-like protein